MNNGLLIFISLGGDFMNKMHYKMFKSGKTWMFIAISTSIVGIASINQVSTVHADVTANNVSSTASSVAASSMPTSSATASSATTSSATASSVSTSSATASSATTSSATASSATASSTTTSSAAPSSVATSSVPVSSNVNPTVTVTKDNFLDYFQLNGSATYDASTGTITLTTDQKDQTGNVTLKNKITADQSFNFSGWINLGTKSQPNGADGISFGFHSGDTDQVGQQGGSLSFAGLQNAFGWKADTYWNSQGTGVDAGYFDADPSEFGSVDGHGKAYGAFVYTADVNNKYKAITYDGTDDPAQEIDEPDGTYKEFDLAYDANTKKMTITYDGKTWVQNITGYLNSDSLAFFIAASTGGASNLQQIILNSFTYVAYGSAKIHYVDDTTNNEIVEAQEEDGMIPTAVDLTDVINTTISQIEGLGKGYQLAGVTASSDTDFNAKTGVLIYSTLPGDITVHFSRRTSSVKVAYIDNYGNVIATGNVTYPNETEYVGDLYSTDQLAIKGYTFEKMADNSLPGSGTLPVGGGTVTYVYTKNAPTIDTGTITKTVKYQDNHGNTLAPDFKDSVIITKSTDAVTDEVTYSPETAVLGFQTNPTIEGYRVIINPNGSTTSQTVKYGDSDEVFTVIYAPDYSMSSKTSNETIHYVDQNGKEVNSDYQATPITFITVHNPVTNQDTVYYSITATKANLDNDGVPTGNDWKVGMEASFDAIQNPVINGYKVISNSALNSDLKQVGIQTVTGNSGNLVYTVVYAPEYSQSSKAVNETIHYVDQRGKTVNADYTSAPITFITVHNPVTNQDFNYYSITATKANLDNNGLPIGNDWHSGDVSVFDSVLNPVIRGYRVVSSDAPNSDLKQIGTQRVTWESNNLVYEVVYAKDANRPAQPGKPITPGKPVQPSRPTRPSKPMQPNKPTNPSKMVKINRPMEPISPVKPGKKVNIAVENKKSNPLGREKISVVSDKLPQTNEQSDRKSVILGMIMGVVTLTIGWLRKKNR